ncbi:MAG: hypothetical protein RLZZ450_2350 [Pseudomonadota bacterium]|jgi:hypothetical protein
MRTQYARLLAVAVAGLCLAACAPEQTLVPATEVIVRVDASTAVRTQAHAIRVRIASSEGSTWKEEAPLVYPLHERPWPLDLVVVLRPGSSATLFELVLEAIDSATPAAVLSQERRLARFEAQRALLLEVALGECGERGLGFVCEEDPECHGAACLSCIDARCAQTPRAGVLPEWDGLAGTPFGERDAATQKPEAGAKPGDAGAGPADAAASLPDECSVNNGGCSEHATCTDTPAGPLCSCDSGFADRGTDGTDCVDKCTMAGCDEHATCAIMGANTACSCTPPYVGSGKVCAFDESCSRLACDPHASCEMAGAGSPRCKCQPGYTGSGTQCSNVDECKQTPSPCGANSTCSDSEGAYACACVSGYRDTGSGCKLIDGNDCSPNPCANGGTCSDLVNAFSCKCAAGFDGERCERNIDDCDPSSCANGSCVDGVATYTCRCATGYMASADQKACPQFDDCVGSACGQGGVCVDGTNTYSCTCSSGYSGTGTKSCVNIDDCAAANTCSPEGTCIDGLNSYMCNCNGNVPAGVPANSCRFTNKGDGVYDAQTGLSWSEQIYEIYKSTDTPQAGCQRQGEGRRPPTVAELQAVIAFDYFNTTFFSDPVRRCWATTTVDVCGPGSTPAPDLHGLRCVR